MTQYEIEFCTMLSHAARDIAHELKVANELKAIELKSKGDDTTIALVDEALSKR